MSQTQFDPSLYTVQEIEHIKGSILQKSTLDSVTGCRLWTAQSYQGRYPQKKIKFHNQGWKPMYAHRVVYAIYSMETIGAPDQQDYHVSHLCHNKRCVQFLHLTFEHISVNGLRKACAAKQSCLKHEYEGKILPECIFV